MTDLKYAVRQLLKNPGFAAAAVLTLAMGIGFVTTLFTMISGVAYGQLPFEDAKRIVSIGVPVAGFDAFAREQTSCEAIAFASPAPQNLRVDQFVSRYPAAVVSENFLRVLRAKPAMGRGFLAEDGIAGAAPVVLIGHSVWQREFDSSNDVIGRGIKVNGEVRSVVGVMPEGFGFPFNQEVWTPRRADEPVPGGFVFGRLRRDTGVDAAADEFAAIGRRLQKAGALDLNANSFVWDADTKMDSNGEVRRVAVIPFAERGVKDALRRMLTAIFSATFLVLLLACGNVANLFLARSVDRRKEMAIRTALGAGRVRLIRQMLLESLVVASLGAAAGLLIASISTRMIWMYIMTERPLTGGAPFWINFDVDDRVYCFVAALALLTTLFTGLMPALKASRITPNDALKENSGNGRRVSRFTGSLVNAQMAFSVCLVTVAGLFAAVLIAFNHKSLVYDPSSILTARVSLDDRKYDDPAIRTRFFDELILRLRSVPGIAAAELVSPEALRMVDMRSIEFEGATYDRPNDRPVCVMESVSPGFLAGYGVDLVKGRRLSEHDGPEEQAVAVVNSVFASRFGQDAEVIGRRFRLVSSGPTPGPWITIVGVTPDLGSVKAGKASWGPAIYRPLAQAPYRAMTLLVRGSGDSSRFATEIRKAVASLDRDLPVGRLQTVQAIIGMERVGMNAFGALFIVCGAGALMLAGVGLYGVVALGVRLRTREFGIRLAIGATRRDLRWDVVRHGLKLIGVGLVVGIALAIAASVVIGSILPEFAASNHGAWIYASAITVLTAVGGAALWIPARRASMADPIQALRAE